MARPERALLACLLVVLLLAAAGCGGQDDARETDEAKKLIDQANAIGDKTAVLEERMNELWPKISKIDPAEDAGDALAMLEDAETGYDEMTKNQESVAKLYAKVSKLDVSEELKTWAGQQKEIADLSIQATAVLHEFVAKDKVLFSLWNQLSRANRDKLIKELNDLDAKRMELWTRANDMQQASQQYFIDNVVGETGAFGQPTADESSRGWVAAGIGGAVVAALSAFVCGYVARRKNRNVVGWAVVGFLLPLVALIVILLLARKKPQVAAATTAPRPRRLIPPRPHPRRHRPEERTTGREDDESG